eukprot:COSAG03_NODE_4255_length_1620_cov_1.239316_1_plen_79_part_00
MSATANLTENCGALRAAEHSLDFNHDTQTGVVFHLMGTLSMYPLHIIYIYDIYIAIYIQILHTHVAYILHGAGTGKLV